MMVVISKKVVSVSFFLLLKVSTCLTIEFLQYKNCSTILNITLHSDKDVSVGDEYRRSECPPWFRTDERGGCQRGPLLDGIIHQDMSTLQTSIMECNCMTEENGTLSVGACIYTCTAYMYHGYYPLPCRVSELQNFTCADLNRRGHLCGECMEGYTIPVYSYDLHCVKCEDYEYNWLEYLLVAFLPLTLFYVVVTLFSISFTSPLLSGLVLIFQISANPIQLQICLSDVEAGYIVHPMALKIVLSLASLWNLDFFRMFYSFCLHPNTSAMEIMALDYVLAVYPVFLIAITYMMVKLHDYNWKTLVWAWRSFSKILKPLRRQWNSKASLVDVFASFIYISSSRLLWTSMNFLVPITVYTQHTGEIHPKLTAKHYLFTAPSLEYFGKEHLPFVFLAMVVLFLLFIVPMVLLFVYPFRWFQHILNKIGINSLVLRTFMEVFQGSYKDGTNRTKDYRFFSGFLLFLPFALTLTFSLTKSSFYYPIASIWILLYLTLYIVCQPFKRRSHNCIMIVMATALLGIYWCLVLNVAAGSQQIQSEVNETFRLLSNWLVAVPLSIIFLYLLVLVCLLFRRIISK